MPAEINRQLTYLSERNIDDAFVKHFKDTLQQRTEN